MLQKHAVVFGARATTAQLYPGRDTFEFNQGHVTKNQPITVLEYRIDPRGYEHHWTSSWNKDWKKIQARTGFEPMTSAILVQRST